ncbi:hypothetical protein WR25_03813 [Diploscapter pachys]|uniref:Mitochondrial import inner membrane translocase subunit n=1 Tax=Diploscapter pachys TaxID=2018661 RepID=A0A2A2J2E8_9BILA|nr:hypothetical protein WR25_03813 [Diploscapter pachys]
MAALSATQMDQNMQTFREFLMQYNNVTERTVSEKEERCSSNCLDKYLKMTQRVSMRFQEHQMISAEAQGAPMKN